MLKVTVLSEVTGEELQTASQDYEWIRDLDWILK